ncbi:MAG: hypothetical protein IMZ70_00940 [Candidatus Atribacteria bacterium]|nr:hypothetical protein [Candidatus Atribacteria bacterium]
MDTITYHQRLIRVLENIEKALRKGRHTEGLKVSHICNGKDLKPYPPVACSMCRNRDEAIELILNEENYKKLEKFLSSIIDRYSDP